MTINFRDWSDGWLKEGFYLSYIREGIRYYEHILQRDMAHWEYPWPETIVALTDSGPFVPADLEITRGYKAETNLNHIWQLIFGIKGQVYIYVELPTDTHRHGIPKVPKPSTAIRYVSHFEEWMSGFMEPTFITEHFMMRPETYQIALSAYNPNSIAQPSVRLNFFISKMITERIGTATNNALTPAKARFQELLEKLHKQLVPCTPISILPVSMPAEAPAGE